MNILKKFANTKILHSYLQQDYQTQLNGFDKKNRQAESKIIFFFFYGKKRIPHKKWLASISLSVNQHSNERKDPRFLQIILVKVEIFKKSQLLLPSSKDVHNKYCQSRFAEQLKVDVVIKYDTQS